MSQSPSEDEINFNSAVDWLNDKLNYIYYDEKGGKWWKNTFYVNEDDEIIIKHISSSKRNTANIRDKNYTVRKFNFEDINPRSIKISEVKETGGRIVKGKVLEIRTFGYEESISKTINNRKGSSTSFLYLSFPEFLNDSIVNYAKIVKDKLEIAIMAKTNVYSSGTEEDIEQVFQVLEGNYKNDNGEIWKTKAIKKYLLELDRGSDKEEFFGYDSGKGQFYLISLSSDGFVINLLTKKNNNKIVLTNESLSLIIETKNSFRLGSAEYFRQ